MNRDLCGEKMKVTDLPIQACNHFDHLALKNWVVFLLYIFSQVSALSSSLQAGRTMLFWGLAVSIPTEINQ